MAYQNTQLDSMLVSALGDDPMLIAELRGAFFASARDHVAALKAAPTVAQWHLAAWRFKGLCASFGAGELAAFAADATESDCGDPAILAGIDMALHALDGAD